MTTNINLTNINTNIFKITLTHKLGIKGTYRKIYPNNTRCLENLYKLQITQSLKKTLYQTHILLDLTKNLKI
jgi:hypothetical protein